MSSKRSLLCQLNQDILHCVYSEWLGSWRDLTALDIACAGKGDGDDDRAAWLSSLSGLVMTRGVNEIPPRYFGVKVVEFYEWLGSRNVIVVENFPVRLDSLEDLQNALNLTTYCSRLCSIDIDRSEVKGVNMEAMRDRFSSFLKQCRCLNSVRIKPHIGSVTTVRLDTMLLSMMAKELQNNTLVKIDLEIDSVSTTTLKSITRLLSNHTSSIRDLMIKSDVPVKESFDGLLNYLDQNRISLRRLTTDFNLSSSQRLLDYLSSFGTLLEILEVGKDYLHDIDLSITEEVLLSIGRACPKLKTFLISTKDRRFSGTTMVRPSELYRICPDLRTLSFPNFWLELVVDDEKREVLFTDNETITLDEKADWIRCVRTVMDRCGYKNLSLWHYDRQFVDDNHWYAVKFTLSPYITSMQVAMKEASLVEAVRDLPRLEKLDISAGDLEFGDVSLGVIVEHASGRLKMLRIHDFSEGGAKFTDQMISQMIRACKKLEVLKIPNAGCESVLAVKNHGCLKEVELEDVAAEESAIASILQEEGENQQHWPPTLRRGVVKRKNVYRFFYLRESHIWVVNR